MTREALTYSHNGKHNHIVKTYYIQGKHVFFAFYQCCLCLHINNIYYKYNISKRKLPVILIMIDLSLFITKDHFIYYYKACK